MFKSTRRIARAFELHSRRLGRELDLTLPQHVVLAAVRDLGEVTSRAVSAEAGVSPATVVGILDKLEAKGLIQRYRSTRDRRIVHTRITARGQETLARAPAPLGLRFEAEFLRLDADERAQTVAAFERVARLAEAPEMIELDEPADRGRP